MSSSTPTPKFLIDENVHFDLVRFLRNIGVDLKLARKGVSDSNLVLISQKEKRILVTNDSDFSYYKRKEVFSVVLLRLPQDKPELLISSFTKMINKVGDFSTKLITLKAKGFEEDFLE